MAVDPEAPKTCDEGCSLCCQREFQKKNFLLNFYDNRHFVQFQCGGSVLAYWFWRLLWALYHVIWIILTGVYSWQWAGSDQAQQIKWFIYLTNWTYFMLTLSTLVDFLCVSYINWIAKDIKDGTVLSTPWFLKANWVLFNVGNSSSIVVSLLYWGVVYDPDQLNAVNIETHALNTIYVIINIFVTKFPIRLLHFFHGVIYSIVYVVFSVIYQVAGGTNANNKNYIYSALDWDNTGFTLGLSLGTIFVAMPLVHAVMFGLYKLRVFVYNKCCRSISSASNEALELSQKSVKQYN